FLSSLQPLLRPSPCVDSARDKEEEGMNGPSLLVFIAPFSKGVNLSHLNIPYSASRALRGYRKFSTLHPFSCLGYGMVSACRSARVLFRKAAVHRRVVAGVAA